MAISWVQLKEYKHFNCIRWLNNSNVKFCDSHKIKNKTKDRLHMYIKILYNRAAHKLYFKAYIKYKNKRQAKMLASSLEATLFSRQAALALARIDKWQYGKHLGSETQWVWVQIIRYAQTWNGDEFKCRKFVTRHIVCMQQREREREQEPFVQMRSVSG